MGSLKQKGFTLIEIMIVAVVIAVLLLLVLPSYQGQLRDTRRSLANAALIDIMMRQEQYFIDHRQYADTLSNLGFPASPYAIDTEGHVVDLLNENRVYRIELTTMNYGYTLYATPQLSQAKDRLCGALSLHSSGIKLAAGEGSVRECW